MCSNIPAEPAYLAYLSQLIRYSRACGSYQDFLDRGLPTRKLLNQGFLMAKWKSSFQMLYCRHHDLVDRIGIYVSQMPTICSTCSKHLPVLSSFMTYHRICNYNNATGVTSGGGNAYPSREPEFTPGFQWSSCYSIFSFMCMFCRSLFVLLSFFFFGHCVVCPSFYGFWLPLWYLQTLLTMN
jgi:hypothetical protein